MLEAPRLFNVGIVHGYPELVRATPNPIVGSSPGWVNGTSSQRAVLGNAPEKAKVASGVNGHWRGLGDFFRVNTSNYVKRILVYPSPAFRISVWAEVPVIETLISDHLVSLRQDRWGDGSKSSDGVTMKM
ncbi:hypothetical protein SNOG_06292 [Parastagonospora nodorum SN15]|uniref:Uncharacterized protein n=1 Tax=Phaeosphaeria nodorum (strain SN15 / ATCC MYA-4574 / FGSC 10173) TaxID=321614 RepID=Q0UPM2_PHANO|nr:hypothetical protein SNOG_06292 [Parastagonospora nodorum SN15]EAT86123.1 hypothetical protein SNOG_06292 [Parastagonospora nodorum SN15]